MTSSRQPSLYLGCCLGPTPSCGVVLGASVAHTGLTQERHMASQTLGVGRSRAAEGSGSCPTMHWASTAEICWMSSTVLTLRETRVSVMFLRIWARSCHLESGSAAAARACSYCGW